MCRIIKCFPCKGREEGEGDTKSQCRGMGCAYQILCITCKKEGKVRVYEGESGFSGRERGNEHERLWKAKDMKSVMHTHDLQEHGGAKSEYKMIILRKYKNAFERQSNEPIRIKLANKNENLNSKTEWHSQQVERLRSVEVGEQNRNNDTRRGMENRLVITENTENIVNNGKRKPGRPKGSQNHKNK